MAGYVVGLLIVLWLWALALQPVMVRVQQRFSLMASQAMAYWAILLAVGYGACVLLTEFVLPHSRLISNWTQNQLQTVTQWSHALGLLLLAGLLARVYVQLFPARPTPIAADMSAKARLKAMQKKHRA